MGHDDITIYVSICAWVIIKTFRHNSAKKDNDFIYHDRVPDKAILPDVKGASLVKALPFDPSNSAVTGPDIFNKLVPMEAHLAASTYR